MSGNPEIALVDEVSDLSAVPTILRQPRSSNHGEPCRFIRSMLGTSKATITLIRITDEAKPTAGALLICSAVEADGLELL